MTAPLTTQSLQLLLTQSLSPDAPTRRAAEQTLTQAKCAPGHALVVLDLISELTSPEGMEIRQSAAVHFKNLVKKGWDPEKSEARFRIPPRAKTVIKNSLVEVMSTVPPQIQSQIAESIALIASTDFPKKWANLLPNLISRLDTTVAVDWDVVRGVLLTADSVFKRFRYVQRSDALYADILYVLKLLQEPLTKLFLNLVARLQGGGAPPQAMVSCSQALIRVCRIFYSLNYQDLPAYFHDNMYKWMGGFVALLSYEHHALVDEDKEMATGSIENMKVAVLLNLYLYANRDEDQFIWFVSAFIPLVWKLLMTVTPLAKHDALAAISIQFLSSLIGKPMHKESFEGKERLTAIFEKIVIPNFMIREIDEERFEDDPQEFILSDMEDSATESRRKCTQKLLRAMCRQFEQQTTLICSNCVNQMLNQFASDKSQWKMKDCSIRLMLGIAIRAETNQFGVSQVNEGVNVMDFYSSHILTELQEPDMNRCPMVKATCIKFVSIFRNQFAREQFGSLMNLLIAHLGSPHVVVHTYSAVSIEKILTSKVDGPSNTKLPKISGSDLKPFLGNLFTGLFAIIEHVEWNENESVMKCIMRALNTAKDYLSEDVRRVSKKLTSALVLVAKNPKNTQYNHYLFESIAVLIRSVSTKDPVHLSAFGQTLLFPSFLHVLQMEVVELTPNVFQLLAQLLEFSPDGVGLGQAYGSLLPPLLTTTLWERKGNIPALARLLAAYLSKGSTEIVQKNLLLGILGVFQKLIANKASETYAFDLLRAIVLFVPREALMPRMKDIFQILMMRLQNGRTPKHEDLVTDFFAVFIGKLGSQTWLDQLDQIQPELALMILTQVWVPRLQVRPLTRLEAKTQAIGLTKLLCETPALRANVWSQIMTCVVKIIVSPESQLNSLATGGNDDDAEIGYDATFSVLHFASHTAKDPFPDVPDANVFLVLSLSQLCASLLVRLWSV